MAVSDRDRYTGKLTTGHEWDGIRELDNPVPKPVLFFLVAGILFVIVWTVLMPAWPTFTGYSRGLLGVDQRSEVERSVSNAAAERSIWADRIATEDFAAIESDPALMTIASEAGATLFGDNCAACHGVSARGGPGFPNLAEGPLLWGEDAEAIAQTIRAGINSGHDQSRRAQMLAFGRLQMLQSEEIRLVVDYVRSLFDPSAAGPADMGAEVFARNCAGCHGADGKGTATLAPDLTDSYWIYGGDSHSIFVSVSNGRQGHMPHWENRLSPVDIRLLTLYVRNLRRSQS